MSWTVPSLLALKLVLQTINLAVIIARKSTLSSGVAAALIATESTEIVLSIAILVFNYTQYNVFLPLGLTGVGIAVDLGLLVPLFQAYRQTKKNLWLLPIILTILDILVDALLVYLFIKRRAVVVTPAIVGVPAATVIPTAPVAIASNNLVLTPLPLAMPTYSDNLASSIRNQLTDLVDQAVNTRLDTAIQAVQNVGNELQTGVNTTISQLKQARH